MSPLLDQVHKFLLSLNVIIRNGKAVSDVGDGRALVESYPSMIFVGVVLQ